MIKKKPLVSILIANYNNSLYIRQCIDSLDSQNYKNLEINQSDYSKDAYEDLYEMATFDHFIISNSSYSWWASYLGEKENSIIIAPEYWYKDKKTKEIPLFRKN